jgi:catechol 2,3-dioxygenase-like lactoylglutathione lyase family enzyme
MCAARHRIVHRIRNRADRRIRHDLGPVWNSRRGAILRLPGGPAGFGRARTLEVAMMRVVGIDHLSIRVSDFKKSRQFYSRLFTFLGFGLSDEYDDAIGWTNGKTRFWISRADATGRSRKYRIGDVGFHHYAFQLRSRKDVDELQTFLREELGATIVDPADEYYDDYYAVFFLDPDGLKLEGMKYGERQARAARAKSATRKRAK